MMGRLRLFAFVFSLLASGCATRVTAIRYEGVDSSDLLSRLSPMDRGPPRRGFDGVFVRFSADEDLHAIEERGSLYGFASRCRNGQFDDLNSLFSGSLFFAEHTLPGVAVPPGRALYWTRISRLTLAEGPHPSAANPRIAYDLREGNEDLCVRLSGNMEMLFRVRSNTVIVPVADIRRALSLP
jgi:hypothetical protein